jgi:hypothetical protein
MKSLLVIAAVAIAFGVVALQCAAAGDADENWTPVHLPFPPPGRVVLGQFHLSSGGIFEIQVLTTAQEDEKRSSPEGRAVDLAATVTVTGPHGFRATKTVHRMRVSAWAADVNFYSADELLTFPVRGDYQIALETFSRVPLFTAQGAVVRLERSTVFTERFTPMVLTFSAYCAFGFALIVVFVAVRQWPRP